MAKLFNLNEKINKYGKNEYTSHDFVEEWAVAIVLFVLLRIVAMFASGYGSFNFYDIFIFEHTQNYWLAKISGIITVTIVEILTSFTLSKFFKFLYKKSPIQAIFAGIVVTMLFTLTFISTTEGLALRQYQKTDKTELITNNSTLQIDNVKADYSNQIEEIRKSIELLKLQTWKGKLNPSDIATIKQYNQKIFELKTEQNNRIQALKSELDNNIVENKNIATIEAKRYYNTGIYIMIGQIITSAVLMFFWNRIFNEKSTIDEKVKEQIKTMSDVTDTLIFHSVGNRILDVQATYLSQFSEINASRKTQLIEIPMNGISFSNSLSTGKNEDETKKAESEKNKEEAKAKDVKTDKVIIGGFAAKTPNEQIIESFENKKVAKDVSNESKESITTHNNDTIIMSNTKRTKRFENINCKFCQKSFSPYNVIQKFCSIECREDWHLKEKGFDLDLYKKGIRKKGGKHGK